MMYLAYTGAILLALVSQAAAHSWVACTDYRGDINYYQNDKCFGYPRNWKRARGIVPESLAAHPKGYNIGVDTGYEYRATENEACQYPLAKPYTSAYTDDYPMATYEKGEVYCLAWPTKNHAAATCTNQYIPDNDLKLYVSAVNPTVDPNQATFKLRNVNGLQECKNNNGAECYLGLSKHQSGVIDCAGFQRAPKFCENTDKALAHACFRVPSTLSTGHFIFQWYWEFNKGEIYTTCWDAMVVPKGQGPQRPVSPGTKGTPDTTLCPGGNCKCTNNYLAFTGGNPAPAPAPTPSPPNPTPAPAPTPRPTPAPQPQPQPTPAPNPQPQPQPTPSPSNGKCIWETECGLTGCGEGLTCKKHQYWSQCVEPDFVTSKTGCTATNNWGCHQKGCCNPAAVCTDNRMCKLPCQL